MTVKEKKFLNQRLSADQTGIEIQSNSFITSLKGILCVAINGC